MKNHMVRNWTSVILLTAFFVANIFLFSKPIKAQATTTVTGGPDLTISDVVINGSYPGPTPTVGDIYLNGKITLQNIGDADATFNPETQYIYQGTVNYSPENPNAELIAGLSTGTGTIIIGAGESKTFDFSTTQNESFRSSTGYLGSAGEKTLYFMVDKNNAIAEVNETNNIFTKVITVAASTTPIVHIMLDGTTPSNQTVSPGQTGVTFLRAALWGGYSTTKITDIVVGAGSSAAASFVSNIKVLNFDTGTVLGTSTETLSPNGSSYSTNVKLTTPLEVTPATKLTLAITGDVTATAQSSIRLGIIDFKFDTTGGTVTNKPLFGNQVSINTENQKPDLTIKNFKYSKLYGSSTDILMEFDIVNIGVVKPSDDFKLTVTNLTNGKVLRDTAYAALYFEPNTYTARVKVTGKLGNELAPGDNKMEIVVDAYKNVAELNEDNNIISSTVSAGTETSSQALYTGDGVYNVHSGDKVKLTNGAILEAVFSETGESTSNMREVKFNVYDEQGVLLGTTHPTHLGWINDIYEYGSYNFKIFIMQLGVIDGAWTSKMEFISVKDESNESNLSKNGEVRTMLAPKSGYYAFKLLSYDSAASTQMIDINNNINLSVPAVPGATQLQLVSPLKANTSYIIFNSSTEGIDQLEVDTATTGITTVTLTKALTGNYPVSGTYVVPLMGDYWGRFPTPEAPYNLGFFEKGQEIKVAHSSNLNYSQVGPFTSSNNPSYFYITQDEDVFTAYFDEGFGIGFLDGKWQVYYAETPVVSPYPIKFPVVKANNPGEVHPYMSELRKGSLTPLGYSTDKLLSDREAKLMARIKQLEYRLSQLEKEVVEREKGLVKKVDPALTQRLGGKILLQVENKGEAWYVDKDTNKKFYLKDGNTAYAALQAFGLGITNKNLEKIPVATDTQAAVVDTDGDGLDDKLEESLGTDKEKADSDGDGYRDGDEVKNNYSPLGKEKMVNDQKLAGSLNGKIVLQVENKGEAWYVLDGKRYYLKDGASAYEIMRKKSLGVKNSDLQKIDVGEFE